MSQSQAVTRQRQINSSKPDENVRLSKADKLNILWSLIRNPMGFFKKKLSLEARLRNKSSQKRTFEDREKLNFINWVLEQDKSRKTVVICPLCGEKMISFFAVAEPFEVKKNFVCCDSIGCLNSLFLKVGEDAELLPVRFSSLSVSANGNTDELTRRFKFDRNQMNRIVNNVLSHAYGARRLTAAQLYELFEKNDGV